MCLYLRTKLQVSSIILTSFRQGVILLPPPQNEPLKSPPTLGLKEITKKIKKKAHKKIFYGPSKLFKNVS